MCCEPNSSRVDLRKDCDVVRIEFQSRAGLRGFLSPAFLELKKLRRLDLQYTEVSGDLQRLSECRSLEWLHLSHSKVTGKLEALENATNLKGLYMANMEVAGDLSALQNANELLFVDLSYTRVAGELQGIEGAEGLYSMDLSHTNVTGDLDGLPLSLTRLDVSYTKVAGDIQGLQSALKDAENLGYLDISGTDLEGDVSELQLDFLETFKATGCRLHGSFDGDSFESLVTLDLTATQVSHVEVIPSKCRTLLLAHIDSMSFAPGLLREAVEDYVFVDLSNVTFTNRTEARQVVPCLSSLIITRIASLQACRVSC